MSQENILVVEDEADILELIQFNLQREGYKVTGVRNGKEALNMALAKPPDLVILDLMLPGLDGMEVCKGIKLDQRTRTVPVIMLTAKAEESDIVSGLEVGADDYITKPFSNKVLIARVRVILRRRKEAVAGVATTAPLRLHELTIDPGKREVLVRNKPIELTFTEFGILHLLARRPGWVFSREQIVDEVKGADYPVTDRAVDVQIVGLRRKLDAAADRIETVRGVGYRFKE